MVGDVLRNHQSRWLWVPAFAGTTGGGIASRSEQPGVLRLVAEACEIGAEGRAAEIVHARADCAVGRGGDERLQPGKHALAVGLSERNEPAGRRYPVRHQRVKIS